MTEQEILNAIRLSSYGSVQILDLVETALDQHVPILELDAVIAEVESGAAGFDPTGELLGEEYWRKIAGEPRRLEWPIKEEKRRGGNARVDQQHGLLIPCGVTDKRRKGKQLNT